MEPTKLLIKAWQPFINSISNWKLIVGNVQPHNTLCGLVYELINPVDRPQESFAIVDMEHLIITEPHYHANNETEIYFVLQGSGIVVVANKEQYIAKGSVIVTLPNTTHYIIPTKGLVLAVINTPPFNHNNYVTVTQTNHEVGFDHELFKALVININKESMK